LISGSFVVFYQISSLVFSCSNVHNSQSPQTFWWYIGDSWRNSICTTVTFGSALLVWSRVPCNSWWWHSLPKYFEFFINKFFLILWNHLVILSFVTSHFFRTKKIHVFILWMLMVEGSLQDDDDVFLLNFVFHCLT
jgi:hypothetical protein